MIWCNRAKQCGGCNRGVLQVSVAMVVSSSRTRACCWGCSCVCGVITDRRLNKPSGAAAIPGHQPTEQQMTQAELQQTVRCVLCQSSPRRARIIMMDGKKRPHYKVKSRTQSGRYCLLYTVRSIDYILYRDSLTCSRPFRTRPPGTSTCTHIQSLTVPRWVGVMRHVSTQRSKPTVSRTDMGLADGGRGGQVSGWREVIWWEGGLGGGGGGRGDGGKEDHHDDGAPAMSVFVLCLPQRCQASFLCATQDTGRILRRPAHGHQDTPRIDANAPIDLRQFYVLAMLFTIIKLDCTILIQGFHVQFPPSFLTNAMVWYDCITRDLC